MTLLFVALAFMAGSLVGMMIAMVLMAAGRASLGVPVAPSPVPAPPAVFSPPEMTRPVWIAQSRGTH